jgi:Kyakuja-Dileera-Zisupton transposase
MDPEVYKRLTFSVSLFHTFAHIYACQALYSPRKLAGLGLTNGEGNERIWSELAYSTLLHTAYVQAFYSVFASLVVV